MQARATLAPLTYFCVEVVRKLFTHTYRQTVKTLCPEKKLKKKKKKERESDVWNFPGLEEGSGNPQLKNGQASATSA